MRSSLWLSATNPGGGKVFVVFTSDTTRLTEKGRFGERAGSVAGRYALTRAAEADQHVRDLPVFGIGKRPGYSVAMADTKPDKDRRDLAYAAVSSIASAARAKCRVGTRHGQDHDVCRIVLPVVVVSSPLVECYLHPQTDEIHIAECEQHLLVWRHPLFLGMEHTMIHIVQESAVPSFVLRPQCLRVSR